jgi:hypothetical protein
VVPGTTSALVSWTTDEPSTSSVAYGPSSAYENGSVDDAALVTAHSLTLTGLTPNSLYHFQVRSTDGAGNQAVTADDTFTTSGSTTGPSIDVWYDLNQDFGHIGNPQQWVNILGNVSDPDGVNSLVYSLNGGPQQTLSIGPDSRRLADPGDFNIDIDQANLVNGANQVVITAVDGISNQSSTTVIVNYSPGNTWPLPYSIDWSTTTDIQQLAQVVDGMWSIQPDGLRIDIPNYDRLMAIGDVTWTDYEVVVPMTIHNVDYAGSGGASGAPGLGVVMRWQGHTDNPVSGWQPKTGWNPHGAIGWWRFNSPTDVQLEWYTKDVFQNFIPALETTYLFKIRVESTPGLGGLYNLKVWEAGQSEPVDWNITLQQGPNNLASGSFMLLAHHVDVTFGDLTVVPLSGPTTYTLGVNTVGSGSVQLNPDQPAYNSGETVQLTAMADPGWVFDSWSGDLTGSTNPATVTMDSDKNVTATFVEMTTYTLSVSTVGSGSVQLNPDQPSYNPGETVQLTAVADPGWIFDSWSGDLTGSTNPASVTMDNDKNITATFVDAGGTTYTLGVSTVGSGSVQMNPDQPSYNPGETVQLTAVADPGWIFDSWSGDLTGSTNPASVTMDSDKNVTATFVTDSTPPVISNVQVTPGTTSALVSWTTDEPSTSSVAYGPSSAYENGSVDDAALVTAHSLTLTGLTPNSLYHFQVRSTDGAGNQAVTTDDTFTTLDYSDPSGIVSDDFNVCTLDGSVWTLVDPLGDASFTMNGTQALLSVPAGVNHDVWSDGNRAPRLMQAANDTDFELEVKFESPMDARNQIQGILVEQDADNYMRFDFYSDGNRTRVFAATIVNGSPARIVNTRIGSAGISPLYLRVTRVGDQWTQAFSLDGVNWTVAVDAHTHALSVTGVGVFVGNAKSNPAHTGIIDYFFNTASPIIPEDANVVTCP